MSEGQNDSVASEQTPPKRQVGQRIFLGVVIIGLLSLAYHVFDLAFPNHFVGDMYGLEVVIRLFLVIVVSIPIVVGAGLLIILRKRRIKTLGVIATALIVISCLAYLVMGITTAHSRWQWRVRDSYPRRSVEELLHLAREKKDQFAIVALLIKKDPTAVPGLCEILLDEHEEGRLRDCAAHALGEIGGDQAREALKEALARNPHKYLKIAIEYALETRMGIPKPVPDSNNIHGND